MAARRDALKRLVEAQLCHEDNLSWGKKKCACVLVRAYVLKARGPGPEMTPNHFWD